MFFSVFLVAASLVGAAFEQLRVDGTYYIVNPQTGFRWDVRESNPAAGTDVIGFPPQKPGLNQRWTIIRVTTQGASGIYTFLPFVPAGRSAYSNGIQGDAIRSQPFSSPFNVTQRAAGNGSFFLITIPDSPFAVTSPSALLVLQALEPTNNLNFWTFQGVQ